MSYNEELAHFLSIYLCDQDANGDLDRKEIEKQILAFMNNRRKIFENEL